MTARSGVQRAAVLVTMLMLLSVPIAASANADVEGFTDAESTGELEETILPIESTVLDIVTTIEDMSAGTRTTEAPEETVIELDADVFFEFDEYELLPDAEAVLEDVADQIAAAEVADVHIGGHTDSVGEDAYNQELSENRAASVEAFLSELVDVEFITEGFGPHEPVAPNETEDGEDFLEGREQNRRVEIRYPAG